MRLNKLLLLSALFLNACLPSLPPPNQGPITNPQPSLPTADSQPVSPSDLQPDTTQSTSPHADTLDVTRLTLGDGKYSTSPQSGYVYVCNTQFNGGGASGTGPWMNGDGTWDLTKKYTVDGSVSWPHSFTISVQGSDRIFASNDLPNHTTGNYPIDLNDDAYQIDRNPNSIAAQNVNFSVPANPAVAAQPTCVGGEVGIMLSGVLIFNAFDAEGRDAVAREVQDHCDGHPQKENYYHYHSLSNCIEDNAAGHSALVGYAFDGFGIYGYYSEDGKEITNADLDACHGHTHVVEWDGQAVEMYHYHATREFPYVVGCFIGTPSVRALTVEGMGQINGKSDGNQTQSQGEGAGSPPQEAFNACVNLSQGAACSLNTPLGTINGICSLPPNSQQLACVPTP